ncbi:hypothetical protein GCM10027290_27110 [Micromonospora sonneratiae]|uniref:Uncharacterized protein n=1 Tax=Micromonospora sonneratiae TaxID=1184706 RepID=A0ABW3YDR8_9ACTN
MDRDLYPERIAYPPGPIVTGRVVRLLGGYSREMKVQQPALVAVLTAATVARLIGTLVLSVLRAGTGSGSRRKFKELRKGPEFLVTPLRIRDTAGVLCEMEIHGHLPQSALEPADHIQVTVRPQKDAELAPRVERIVNITTGQLLTPRIPTLWSHLGPALVLQAMLGLLAVAVVVAILLGSVG